MTLFEQKAGRIGAILAKKGLRLAVAESCTGGLLGYAVTSVPGSSDWFAGGVIAYANGVKSGQLGVSAAALAKHGAVSRTVAAQMAEGARKRLRADVGVGVTGIAGPGGGTRHKPVGLVFVAAADGARKKTRRFLFRGSRRRVRLSACAAAMDVLLALLNSKRG